MNTLLATFQRQLHLVLANRGFKSQHNLFRSLDLKQHTGENRSDTCSRGRTFL